uniref:Rx N-terminal domain-containing protein n=1 Tax=Aegilops tauschii subsp. strangulata TaxID=200361 RepID=A0A453A973_AEGTS
MQLQLKMLSEAMYGGYSVLDTLRYRTIQDSAGFHEVSIYDSSCSNLYLDIPLKRSRTTEKNDKTMRLESHGSLESLEVVVANMTEFVMLLDGCERMSRRPYDVYLYTENFMFGRHAEKQKLLSFLLQHNNPPGDHARAVLPIIGGAAIGKKTLVAHVCSDERVRSRFSSILHLNVIEFASDVGDDDWKKLHSLLITMGRGIKIIIVSKLKRLARFGSVKPIFLSILSYDELRYLFKTLAFGSVDPAEHPRLVQIADQFAKVLHNAQASLVTINKVADVLRRNLDAQFWRCILDKGIKMAKRNLSIHGVHPRILIEQGHPVDISHMTDLASHPLSMTPYTINASIEKQPSVTFGELLTDPSVRPKGDFILISWESRIPPHKSFVHFVTSHAQDTHEASAVPGRKRRGVPV